MIKRFSVLVLTLILAFPALAYAQTTSEEFVRIHYLAKLTDYSSRRTALEAAESGLADQDVDRAIANARRAVIDCFLDELEVVALTNNIDEHTFMDALAFVIAWQSEEEFFASLKGVEHLGKSAQQCMKSGFETQGIRLKRY